MRNSYWIVTFLLVLECVVLLIEPSECILSFIPMSVTTALQILTLLVKIKSIIFKILLGLKLMGVEGFIWRRRRRSLSSQSETKSYLDAKLDSLSESQRTELIMAWRTLERVLGYRIEFYEDVCVNAINTISKRPISIWDGVKLRTNNEASNNSLDDDDDVQRRVGRRLEDLQSNSYSYWVSAVLGSALGSPYACHILEKELRFNSPSSSSSTATYLSQVVDTDVSLTNSVLYTGAFS